MGASPSPPRVPRWLIRTLLSRERAEVILGDLDEEFHVDTVPRLGPRAARLRYWRLALASIAATRSRPWPGRFRSLSAVGHELRIAVRGATRRPAFTAVAAGTLALGIGATTVVFSLVHAVLLRPLPYRSPESLALIWQRFATAASDRRPVPAMDILDLERQTTLFEGFAAVRRPIGATLGGTDLPQHVTLSRSSTDLFRLLGIEPLLGRTFTDRDLATGDDDAFAVMLSHQVWQRVYGGDSTVLNRRVFVSGRAATVAGILPPGFRLILPPDIGMPEAIDAWIPMSPESGRGIRETQRLRDQDSDDTGAVVARLRAGTSLSAARAELDAVAGRLREAVPFYREAGMRFEAFPMHADVTVAARPILTALMGAVGLVLLIACVNVANLMLGRAAYRRREMALRVALGASRTRLIGQLLTEAAVIGAAGAALGLALAAFGLDLFAAYRPAWLPAGQAISLSPAVLGFAIGITALAVVAFGLLPALGASPAAGRVHVRAGGERRGGMRMALVAVEIALSMALLVGTGLLLRTAARLAAVDPGFDAAGVLVFDLTLRNNDRYRGPADRGAFVRSLVSQLRSLPGIEHAALVSRPPLSGRVWTTEYGRDGQPVEQWPANEANLRMITGEFFDAMDIQLVAGRTFGPEDDRQDRRVAIIDRAMADRLGLGAAAVGARLGFPVDGERVWGEIVGVVDNVRYESLAGEIRETIYVPYRHEASRDISVVVRTDAGDPGVLSAEVRRIVGTLDPMVPVHGLRPLAADVRNATAPIRATLLALAGFAFAALLLAAIGLYGVVSFHVARRRHEIGVRLALGARPTSVIRLVVGQGLMAATIGIAGGSVIAVALGSGMRELVYGTTLLDPATFAAVASLIFLVALLASYLPARRASRVDPVTTLRPD